jgi:predicted permease
MQTLIQDLRYGARTLLKQPGFTLIAVLTLALGIGANTAIFSLVNAILLKPLPVAEPWQLISLYTVDEKNRQQFFNLAPISYPNFKDYREQNQVFSGLVAHQQVALSLSTGKEAQQVTGEIVSGEYFDVLGVKASLGRTFLPEEDRTPGTHPVVVLSHRLWQTQFGGAADLVGKTVRLNNQNFTVVGVAPRNFTGTNLLAPVDAWVPMMMYAQVFTGPLREYFNDRRALLLNVTGRLKPNVSQAQAEESLKTLARGLEQQFPRDNEKRSVALVPLPQTAINPNLRDNFVRAGALLMSVVGLVLLIACANVANLLLARALGRRRTRQIDPATADRKPAAGPVGRRARSALRRLGAQRALVVPPAVSGRYPPGHQSECRRTRLHAAHLATNRRPVRTRPGFACHARRSGDRP